MAKKKAKDGTNRGANTKYEPGIVKHLLDLLSAGHGILASCKAVGISHETFYEWKRVHVEFSESLKEVNVNKRTALADMALNGLAKLVSGHEYEEVTKIYEKVEVTINKGKPNERKGKRQQLVGTRVTTKKVMPNQRSVEFVLTNTDSENWKKTQHVDHTTKGKEMFDYSGTGTDELIKRVEALEKLEAHEEAKQEDE